MTAPDFERWQQAVRRIGGCQHPVHMTGPVRLIDGGTGEIVRELGTGGEGHRWMMPCGNRRKRRCEPCSRVYQADAWHLVRAGLTGGKGVDNSVSRHPRAFLTLTAPSFGPVHRRSPNGPCRARSTHTRCEHGLPRGCGQSHDTDDPLIGQALCTGCYDYPGAVLWNAHAGRLWHRFTDVMRRQELPRTAGLDLADFARTVRVSFVKVAEYQARGLVHFHAVVRLDPAEDSPLPAWATYALLDTAIRSARPLVAIDTAHSPAGAWSLTLGERIDVQPIPAAPDPDQDDPAKRRDAARVTSYLAKYVTKAAECTGTVDTPVYCPACKGTGLAGACPRCRGNGLRADLATLPLAPHPRAMLGTAWRLGALPAYESLNLRRWAHQLGYGGHFSTKSRHYSTTMGRLRQTRRDFRSAQTAKALGLTGELITENSLKFTGTGYVDDIEARIAEGIRQDIAEERELLREVIADLKAEERDLREWA